MVENINLAYLVIFFICLLVSAFFSSSETAYLSLQKVRIRHLVDSGVSGAEEVAKMTEQPEKLLTTVLLGNNFVNTAAAALGTMIAVAALDKSKGLIVSTIVVTLMLLVFSEIIPKTIAARFGERMSLMYIRPMKVISWLFYPISYFLAEIGKGAGRIVGGGSIPTRRLISEDEIRAIISMGREDGAVEEGEAEIMERVIRLGERQVAEIMTPRPDIVRLEESITLACFLAIYAESPHSRFPVFDESLDNVKGILWIKDVLLAQAKGELQMDDSVTTFARPAFFVPETKVVGELFGEMQDQRTQVAIVVDEYGVTVGLITMEQLLEEIVGQLGDELAISRKEVESIDSHTFQVDGGMRIDQANEEIALGLPEGDYETIAGFILSELGHIPEEGEQLKYEEVTLLVTEMKGVKIEKIHIIKG